MQRRCKYLGDIELKNILNLTSTYSMDIQLIHENFEPSPILYKTQVSNDMEFAYYKRKGCFK